jgi:hypothetical protein
MRLEQVRFFGLVTIVAAVLTLPTSMLGQKRTPKGATEKILVGFISDASCGLKHMEGMNERDCTLMCAKNGRFVIADREKKIVYQTQAPFSVLPRQARTESKSEGPVSWQANLSQLN